MLKMPNKALHIDRKGRTVFAVKAIFLMFSISVISPMTKYPFRQVSFSLDSISTNFKRKTASNLNAIEEVCVAGIEKSDY